ncbi:hypothetical protein [Pseudomonas fluorescens]|uniref:hypothetical protein n=1 Tax=Pseudomonas fluorescens TaxID=294 RepID=UPI001242243D|nr:hypothetical protein [Pseudomonas fluorescens]
MAGFQADTYQYASLMYVRAITARKAVAKKTWVTSFFISCTKCLWDAVGHFLGRPAVPHGTVSIGLRGSLSLLNARAVVTHSR